MRKKIFTFLLALAASVGMSWATTKSITINESSHGSVVASSSSAAAGETITLTATPDDGYQLKSISGVYETQATSSETLNFVAARTTVTGTKFQCVGTTTANNYGWRVNNTTNTLTVSSLNGTTLIEKIEFTSTWGAQRTNDMLSVSAGTLSFNGSPATTVTINDINATSVTISGSGTNNAKTWCIASVKVYYEGTEEVELEISDTENANVKTFIMVDSEVTISAEFEPAPAPADNSVKLYHNFYGEWAETEAFGIFDDYTSEYAKISMILEPGDYQFALKVGGELRGDGTAFSRDNQACILGEGLTANLTLNVDVKGTYKFYWFYDENRFAMYVPNVCGMYWQDVTDDKFEVTLGKESEVTLPTVYTTNMSFATNIFNGVDQVRLVSTDETVATIEYTLSMSGLGTITLHKAGECDIYAVHDITDYYCYDSVAFHLTVLPEPTPVVNLKLIEFQVPASWENDNTPISSADFPDFVATTYEIASALPVTSEPSLVVFDFPGDDEVSVYTKVDGQVSKQSTGAIKREAFFENTQVHYYYPVLAGDEPVTTGVENVQTNHVQATKFFRDGMLLIEKNGKIYNATGAEVK